MRDNKKKILVIIFYIVMIFSIPLFYISDNYSIFNSSNVNNKNILTDNKIAFNLFEDRTYEDEEVELGDKSIPNCAETKETCANGELKDGKCEITENYSVTVTGCCSSCTGPSASNWNKGKGCCWGCQRSEQRTRTSTEDPVTTCEKCKTGYYPSGDGECGKCEFSLTAGRDKVSPGTQWCVSVTKNKFCGDTPATCTTAKNACGKSTIRITMNGVSHSVSIPVAGDWKKVESEGGDGKVYLKPSNVPEAKTERDADSWMFSERDDLPPTMSYGTPTGNTTADGLVEIDPYYVRGTCGSQPIKVYSYCCVDNEYVGVSNNVKWADHVLYNHNQTVNGKSACAYYYGDDYTYVNVSREKCVKPRDIPERCSSTPSFALTKNQETNGCEVNYEMKFDEGQKCSKNSDYNYSFYTIDCDRTVKTNFDYGDDGSNTTSRVLYKGQGFKFGITVSTVTHCQAEFNGTRWKDVYNIYIEKIKAVDSGLVQFVENYDPDGWINYVNNQLKPTKAKAKSDIFELWNVIKELKGIVDDYNKYEPNSEYDEQAEMNFTYNVKGVKVNSNNKFVQNIVSEGKYVSKYEKVVDLGVKKVTNPKNYERSSEKEPRVVKLYPKETYINTITSEIQDTDKKGITGGNKIYIDYNSDIQTISPLNIKITGMAANSTLVNNKCDASVKDIEISYRPIDISNPFINLKREKGENWVNSEFDFTKTIHANTWSEATRTVIEIPASKISEIQSSNENYIRSKYSPYLGMCDLLDRKNQDEITQYICGLIK